MEVLVGLLYFNLILPSLLPLSFRAGDKHIKRSTSRFFWTCWHLTDPDKKHKHIEKKGKYIKMFYLHLKHLVAHVPCGYRAFSHKYCN